MPGQGSGEAAGFLKSIGRFSIAPIINFILGIAAVVLLTRFFPPDVYGIWNLFNAAANVCVSIVCVGLAEGVLRFSYELPKGWSIQELLWKCILIAFAVFLLFAVVVLYLYEDLSIWLFHQVNLYWILLLIVHTFSLMLLNSFFVSYYRAMNIASYYTVQQIGVQFFSKLFILGAVFWTYSIDSVLTLNVGGLFIFLLICVFLQRGSIFPKELNFSFQGFSEVLQFSLFSWPNGLLSKVSAFLIPFVLAHRLSGYEVGLYAATNVFVAVIVVLNSGFMTYWVAFVYKNAKEKQKLIMQVHNYIILCIVLVFSGMIVFQHAIYILIGAEYQISRVFFTLVMSDVFFSVLEATTQQGIALKKRSYEMAIILLTSLSIQFICAWYLVVGFGVEGAAIATMIAGFVRCLLSTWRGQVYYRSIERWYKTVVGVLVILILALSNYLLFNIYWYEFGVVIVTNAVAVLFFKADIVKGIEMFRMYRRTRAGSI